MSAGRYLAHGFAPIPVPRGTKAPCLPGWQNLRFAADEIRERFSADDNVGLLLGAPSGGLVDVDLDCPEALRLARAFLRPTGLRHGRASKPNSHWYYRCAAPPAPARFSAPDGTCLVELRSTRQQTIVPPSLHPSGETLRWESEGEPAQAEAEALARDVARLAAAALLARCYPQAGIRNEFCLALAGTLLRGGMQPEHAERFIREIARVAGDEEWQARVRAVQSTRERLSKGSPASGGTHLAQMLGPQGPKIVSLARQWLALEAEPQPHKGREPGAATQLLALREEMELFHDGEGRGYATIPVDAHSETWPIRSREFALYLRRRHFGNAQAAVGGEALQSAIETFESQALFSGRKQACHVRVAELGGSHCLDLANDRWEAVEITPAGWRVVSSPPVKFLRPRGMLPLPPPVSGGSIAELRPFLNVAEENDWILIVAWLLAVLRPKGPYPVLALYGEHGSAKSTTARALRSLVDPNRSPLRAAPRETRELMIQAGNAHLLCLDNLSRVPETLSDDLSRLATGGGFSARELYTDDGEKLFDAQRPILLNGIEDLCTRPDLLDRSLAILLPPIPDSARQPEEQFWERFEAARSRVLGALLDAVAAGLRNLPSVKLASSPRMADFARWGAAVEPGLGLRAGAFLRAYRANRQSANGLVLESTPVAVAVGKWMEGRNEWQGTATELLRGLNAAATAEDRAEKGWPANARGLSGALRRVAPNLRANELMVDFLRESTRSHGRLIRLRKIANFGSEPSDASDTQQNQAAPAGAADANPTGSDANASSSDPLRINASDVSDAADANCTLLGRER